MSDRLWLARALRATPEDRLPQVIGCILVRLYELQTQDEQRSDRTRHDNDRGFTATDATSGSRGARFFQAKGELPEWVVDKWMEPSHHGRPRLSKYWRQISPEDLRRRPTSCEREPTVDIEALRKEYRELSKYWRVSVGLDSAQLQARVRDSLGVESPTPNQWNSGLRGLVVSCRRCGGTGQFVTGTVNGKPTGPGGSCFRCEGKGRQTAKDAKRNYWYDTKYQKVRGC